MQTAAGFAFKKTVRLSKPADVRVGCTWTVWHTGACTRLATLKRLHAGTVANCPAAAVCQGVYHWLLQLPRQSARLSQKCHKKVCTTSAGSAFMQAPQLLLMRLDCASRTCQHTAAHLPGRPGLAMLQTRLYNLPPVQTTVAMLACPRRFCSSPVPDWKDTLAGGKHTAHLQQVPVVAVLFEGREWRLRVPPTPEGRLRFQRQVELLTGVPFHEQTHVKFHCKTPKGGCTSVG